MPYLRFGGFSLIELMVVIFLSSILIATFAKIYLAMQNNYLQQQKLARAQENGRFASLILLKNISMAGFIGYDSRSFKDVIQGFDARHLPFYLSKMHIKKDSDVIVMSGKFAEGAGNIVKKAFFIAKTSRKDTMGDDIYALYSKVIANGIVTASQELVDNIFNMKIKYGVDANSNGVIDNYYSANFLDNSSWRKVLGVFIVLYFYVDNKSKQLKKWPIYIALQERI